MSIYFFIGRARKSIFIGITIIAKRLQRMTKEMKRGKLSHNDALSQIIDMAKKYNAYYLSAEDLKHETETEAQIILSESFKQ